MPQKPTDKETLQVELKSLLTAAHGEIKDAATNISNALDQLIKDQSQRNKELFAAAIKEAMAIPKSVHFKSADEQVKKVMLEILEHAKEFLQSGLQDVIALNEKIKQEKKKLKARIDKIEDEKRQFRR